jgi:hypothetical protein
VFASPPPTTGVVGSEETSNTIVFLIVCPDIAAARTEFGLSTIACVMPTISPGGDREFDGVERLDSGNCIFVTVPMVKGVISLIVIFGGPATGVAMPWASTVVPCGIDAIRTTVWRRDGRPRRWRRWRRRWSRNSFATCGRRACGKRTRGRARLIDLNCRRPRHLQSRNRSTRWSGQIGGNATKLLHGVNARQCLVFPRPSADRRQLKYLRLISSVCKRGLKDELG